MPVYPGAFHKRSRAFGWWPPAGLVPAVGEAGDVVLDLGLQRLGQHPPRPLPHDLVDQRGAIGSSGRGALITALGALENYRESMGRTFPTGVGTPALLE